MSTSDKKSNEVKQHLIQHVIQSVIQGVIQGVIQRVIQRVIQHVTQRVIQHVSTAVAHWLCFLSVCRVTYGPCYKIGKWETYYDRPGIEVFNGIMGHSDTFGRQTFMNQTAPARRMKHLWDEDDL